eukprot:8183754-Pyramimonas_sp.AAC.1
MRRSTAFHAGPSPLRSRKRWASLSVRVQTRRAELRRVSRARRTSSANPFPASRSLGRNVPEVRHDMMRSGWPGRGPGDHECSSCRLARFRAAGRSEQFRT